MPLTQKDERANIARHICALASLRGGYIIFGFEDDGEPAEPYPADLAGYGQDAINGIGERHLEPQPHCEVHLVTVASGMVYPVVRVPSHGLVPVCAKRDGPHDAKGQPTGIRAGVHYMRVAGPRSVPIDSPDLWRDLLHRCVLAERATLLSSIGQLFDKVQPSAAYTNALEDWLTLALTAWREVGSGAWPVAIADHYTAFGFRLLREDGEPPHEIALPALRVRLEMRLSRIRTGPHPHPTAQTAYLIGGWVGRCGLLKCALSRIFQTDTQRCDPKRVHRLGLPPQTRQRSLRDGLGRRSARKGNARRGPGRL